MIYPNPNKGEFWIEFNADLLKDSEIQSRQIYILSASGEIIHTISTSERLNRVSLINISNGQYYVVVYDGTRNQSHKVVINK